MNKKSYALSNGITVTQSKATLRKLFKIVELLSGTLLGVLDKLFSGKEQINLKELDVEFIKGVLLNPDNANTFLNIILDAPNPNTGEINYIDLDDDNWLDAVEDFFTLNAKLITKLGSLKNRLALGTLTEQFEGLGKKSDNTPTSSILPTTKVKKPSAS